MHLDHWLCARFAVRLRRIGMLALVSLALACGGSDEEDRIDDAGVHAGPGSGEAGMSNPPADTPICSTDCPDDGSPSTGSCICEALGARMRLDPDADDFFGWPWPHAMRLADAGGLDLTGLPVAADASYLHNNLPILAEGTPGFGTSAALLMSFDAPLAGGSVEGSAADSLEADASVFLVNVDGDSPGYGERIPITCQYRDDPSDYNPPYFLSCLPMPGFPMRGDTTHALVLTDRIEAADGQALGASARFNALDDDDDDLADAYAPLFDYAMDADLDGATIVGGTVFRTQDPVAPMRAIADFVAGIEAPTLEGDLMLSADTPNNPDETGNFSALEGIYEAPIFQAGESPYMTAGGDIRFDGDGAPVVASFMKLRVVISVPTGAPPSDGWPVALYHHGTGGDAASFLHAGHAYHLAEAGVAMISIDAPVHGGRRPAGVDPTLLFFNIQNLLALRDNIRQGAADLLVLQRFAQALDVPRQQSPTGEAVHFDPDKFFYMGHSQGGLTGPLMLAVADGIKGAMLSGAGGSIVTSIIYKKTPLDLLLAARTLFNLPLDEPLDAFHPVLAVVQAFTEPADTSNFVPYFYRWPGGQGLDVWATMALQDEQVPPPITEALVSAAGLPPIEPLDAAIEGLALRGIEALPGPVSGNITGADGEQYTGAFSQYEDGDHFVVSQRPEVEEQLTHWFRTLTEGRGELISQEQP